MPKNFTLIDMESENQNTTLLLNTGTQNYTNLRQMYSIGGQTELKSSHFVWNGTDYVFESFSPWNQPFKVNYIYQ